MKFLMIAVASAAVFAGYGYASAQERQERQQYAQERQEQRVQERERQEERRVEERERREGREGFDLRNENRDFIPVPGEGNPFGARGGAIRGEVDPDRVAPATQDLPPIL
jgi:Ni/Co efflux regulator RcnB